MVIRKILVLSLLLASGCSINRLASRYAAGFMDGFTTAFYRQTDPELARESAVSFLILLDAMIIKDPENPKLLLAGTQACAAYASAFLLEDEPERAHLLLEKALDYGFKLLNVEFDGADFKNMPLDVVKKQVSQMNSRQIPGVYWTASAWAGWILSHQDQILAIGDISKVVAMMESVLKLDPGYQSGGSHLFFGIYYAARPVAFGGNPEKAKLHFTEAKTYAGQESLLPDVLMAKYYARAIFDRELFSSLLNHVLQSKSTVNPDLNLMNALARRQAKKLLESIDDYF
jgi:hypothetical protein